MRNVLIYVALLATIAAVIMVIGDLAEKAGKQTAAIVATASAAKPPEIDPAIVAYLKDNPDVEQNPRAWRKITIDLEPTYRKKLTAEIAKMPRATRIERRLDGPLSLHGALHYRTSEAGITLEMMVPMHITNFPHFVFTQDHEVYVELDTPYHLYWGATVQEDKYNNPVFVFGAPKQELREREKSPMIQL